MQTAIVLGTTHGTIKHASLIGQKLTIVQTIDHVGGHDGPPLLAIDPLGCRRGDRVMITSDGLFAREITGHENTPARWTVIGIQDF